MSTRVYVPATLADLAAYVRADSVPAGTERFLAPDDTEEGEYAALTEAAAASAALLDATGSDVPGRRVVLVAEVAEPDAALSLRELVAVHVDPAPGADPDDDLGWFATQEIPGLLDGSAFGS